MLFRSSIFLSPLTNLQTEGRERKKEKMSRKKEKWRRKKEKSFRGHLIPALYTGRCPYQ
jgi:hypothetical protein